MIRKIDHRTNVLPEDLTKTDIGELRAKGLLKKFFSGPNSAANRSKVDALLAVKTKSNQATPTVSTVRVDLHPQR
jgi:hypothetical protein